MLPIGLVTLTLCSAGWASQWWKAQLETPFRGYLENSRTVEVARGRSIGEIAEQLEESGIIKSATIFKIWARLTGRTFNPKAGEYRFSEALPMLSVAERLNRGDVVQRKITIPEGRDVTEAVTLLVAAGFGEIEDYMAAIQDTSPISDLDPAATDLEGYLLPDTYFLDSQMTEAAIIRKMVENFRRFWTQGPADAAQRQEFTTREIVTLASLIEEEAAVASERGLISAVFRNRLRLGMKLMCDPTVIYAVKREKAYDGIIHRSDLAFDSPYNTYLYPGLPPGPIANPGRAAIQAALSPADSDYLFFVSKNDGTHYFSENYTEHARAVRKFQR